MDSLMEIAIIGFPNSSKTTIFNALTKGQVETTAVPSAKMEVHTAVVDVPDPRVGALSQMFRPRKTTYAHVTYNDIAGMARGMSRQSGLAGNLMNLLSASEALMHVARAFEDDTVPAENGSVNAARDVADMDMELILSDLVIVERRLERLRKEGGKKNADEIALFERLQAALEDEQPMRDIDLSAEQQRALRGFGFLSAKPMLIVLNVGDSGVEDVAERFEYSHQESRVIGLQGRLEAEIAQLDDESRQVFLEEYGISEPGLNRVIRESYDLLGLQSFFTVGEDEVRAWTVRRGATAVEAAGVIHTDLARGFIRAEVVHYDDLVACGSLVEAKNRGVLRLQGKEYIVRDGDIINVRFNV
jgi:ribosome-binding ATPase